MSDDAGATDASRATDGSAAPAPLPWRPQARRLTAAGLLLLTVVAGLAVHSLAPDGAASDIAGDALYAVAAYLAAVVVLPRLRPRTVALIAAAWCTAVELFQLTGVPLRLGAEFSPVMLVLGTVFDARDLVIYLVAVVVMALLDGTFRGAKERVSR